MNTMSDLLDDRAQRLLHDEEPAPMEMDVGLFEGLEEPEDLFPDLFPVYRPEDAPPPYSEHPPAHF